MPYRDLHSASRRHALKALVAGAAAGFGPWHSAMANPDFPNRPVTLIVPWPPGGATDSVLRALATAASKHLGQAIVIANRPGAAGTVGPIGMAASAKPDGYTISQVALSLLRMPYFQDVTYDPLSDFTYIMGVCGYTTGIVVRADAPWKNWQELATYARAHPGKVSYASAGVGSSTHMAMEEISRAAGFAMLHVPLKGAAESIAALQGGHIDVMADATAWGPFVDSGKFRLLVTWGEQRTKRWPTAPTLREVGIDVVANAPYGLAGPKGMPAPVVAKLHDAFRSALKDADYQAVAARFDQEDFYRSPADFTQWAKEQYAAQGRLIKELGLGKKASG
mgnify:CR=1 FL=1